MELADLVKSRIQLQRNLKKIKQEFLNRKKESDKNTVNSKESIDNTNSSTKLALADELIKEGTLEHNSNFIETANEITDEDKNKVETEIAELGDFNIRATLFSREECTMAKLSNFILPDKENIKDENTKTKNNSKEIDETEAIEL